MTENSATFSHAKKWEKINLIQAVLRVCLISSRCWICKESEKLKQELVNRKESRLSTSEIVQMTENAKISEM